ncbi:adhesion G protein-coupled receptor E5 isoform X2 [Macrotis lagotis]|uniref:adhesion G protein-coupled receptor E5 isoform X2 n=1 Tax=Macrotis lagotis TaxID=92651 RepID=UPI003D68FA2D
MPALPRGLFLGLCVLVHLETIVAQISKDPQCDIWCTQHATCINMTHCSCDNGFASTSGKKYFNDILENCDDVNECAGPNGISCGQNADCANTEGSYHCTCISGYTLPSGEKTFPNKTMNNCQDVDECSGPKAISCGLNALCVNTFGSYHCKCSPGYALSSGEETFPNKTMNDCQVTGTSFSPWAPPPGVSEDFLNQLKSITRKFKSTSPEESIKSFVKDMEELLSTTTALEGLPLDSQLQVVTYLLSNLEEILRNLAQSSTEQLLVFHTSRGSELSMNIKKKPKGIVEVGRSHTKMNLDWNLTGGSEKAVVGLFSTRELKTLLTNAPLVLDPGMHADLEQENEAPVREGIPELLSAVSIAFLNNKDTAHLSSPVTFAFSHPNVTEGPRRRVTCAFWQPDGKGSGRWATTGCRKLGSDGAGTTCRCAHLSSFAILMAHYDVDDWKLSVITQVGLGVSLACLLLCVLTFLLCRAIQGSRTTIHLHLCLCLFVGSAVFLAGSANPGQGQVGLRCRLVAGLLHYCFLAAFCWMCLEGLELYFLVVRVFPGPGLRTRWLCLLGYGAPGLVVALSAAVHPGGYGRPRYCWLSLDKGFIWSFLGPVTAVIAFNAFIFVVTVWKLTQKFSEINPDMKKLKKARMLTFTAIAQLCILGCTWIFGLFLFGPESHVLAYIFTILNCFQGCFLFVLHCLLNKKVREEYRRWACIVTKSKYNEFSTSTTSQSRALRPSLESGM